MKLRVTSTGTSGGMQTRIVNAETGETVEGVRSARWAHEDVEDAPVLTLDVIDFEFDAVIDGSNVTVRREQHEQPAPRLMLHSEGRLSPDQIQRLRLHLGDLAARNAPVTVIDGLDVYQLVEGRWVPLDPRIEPASQLDLARNGITADEGVVG